MRVFVPGWAGPSELSNVRLECRFGRHRADLTFDAAGADGEAVTVILETKVNDDLSDGQLRAYSEASDHVVVYAPGLTGLLLSDNPARPGLHARWVTGRLLASALGDVQLPPLLQTYVEEVAARADDLEWARQAARGERDDLPATREGTPVKDLEAVAWVVETAALMRDRGARPWTRNTRHDYGIYWPVDYANEDLNASAYVDVIAAHGGNEYAITIKTGDGEVGDRRAVFELAAERPGPGWRRNRRSSAANYRLWTLDAGQLTAGRAADAALEAGAYIRRVFGA